MFLLQIDNLKQKVQTIIDLMAAKDWKLANTTLLEVSEEIDNLIDQIELDEHLIELSKYHVLTNHLHIKIQNEQL